MIALITAVNECASIAIERLSRAGTEKPEVSLLIGGRGSAQDIVHHDEALARFDLKNNAPGTNTAPKQPPIFALQGRRVARKRVAPHFVERDVDALPISRRQSTDRPPRRSTSFLVP